MHSHLAIKYHLKTQTWSSPLPPCRQNPPTGAYGFGGGGSQVPQKPVVASPIAASKSAGGLGANRFSGTRYGFGDPKATAEVPGEAFPAMAAYCVGCRTELIFLNASLVHLPLSCSWHGPYRWYSCSPGRLIGGDERAERGGDMNSCVGAGSCVAVRDSSWTLCTIAYCSRSLYS